MTPEHHRDLEKAHQLLEHPGFFLRLTQALGRPLDGLLKAMPRTVIEAGNQALRQAFRLSLTGMAPTRDGPPRRWVYKLAVTGSGAVSGFFGGWTLALDLPASTGLMFRAIAAIARAQGEDLADPVARLHCLLVFALGAQEAQPGDEEAVPSAYYLTRLALEDLILDAAGFVAKYGLRAEGSPVVVSLIRRIAARFDILVAEKELAELVPVVGAVGGGTINLFFMNHFQDMATGHFTVRRLERIYGREAVRQAYLDLGNAETQG